MMPRRSLLLFKRAALTGAAMVGAVLSGAVQTGCSVGPNYVPPSAPIAAAFQDPGPWQPAEPKDAIDRGPWWEVFHDPILNGLEKQVALSNQNVIEAEANFRSATETTAIERANFFPTITTSPQYTRSVTSTTTSSGGGFGGGANSGITSTATGIGSTVVTGGSSGGGGNSRTSRGIYNLPVDLTYLVDVWGAVRRSVQADNATAQASYASLISAQLSYQATLAQDYFAVRGLDAEADILERTAASYQKALDLTLNRYKGGVASQSDVAQAQTQLETTRAELIDLGVTRAQNVHAIAVLIGQPAPQFALPHRLGPIALPSLEVGMPSQLLERRPDIAEAERTVAAANAEIGVATAAYYPSFTLNGSSGFESISLDKLFSGPSLFWSVGPVVAQTIFDAGRIHAQVRQARANYDSTVAAYRATVLTALQQIEDDLSGLRILASEAATQHRAVGFANQTVNVTTNGYKAGTLDYLNVITAQTTALSDELTEVTIATRRQTDSVLLIEALGGGWTTRQLPGGAAMSATAADDALLPPSH